MTSQTKSAILARHRANDLLNMPAPSLTQQTEHDLSVDDGIFPLDEEIIAASGGALDDGQTHYVGVPGIDPLREAVATYLETTSGAAFSKDNVLVTAGVQESRFLTVQLIELGRLAVPAAMHPGVSRALGVRPKAYDTMPIDAKRALVTPGAVRAALESGCKVIYLESPSRLTGAAYTADEVQLIADVVKKHEAAVIWDQGLLPWAADGTPSLAGVSGMAEHTALIGEAFPGMGLASWFIGYIAAPESWIPPMQKQKQVMAICTSTPSQYAALTAASQFEQTRTARLKTLSDRRANAVAAAQGAGLTVMAGDVATVLALQMPAKDKAAALTLWADAGYTVADGTDFGAPDMVRLTITPDGTAEDALKLLADREG